MPEPRSGMLTGAAWTMVLLGAAAALPGEPDWGIRGEKLRPTGPCYEAVVPDTLDLAERARLAVRGLTSFLNPQADFAPYGHTYFNANPPYLSDMPGGPPNWGKIAEALIFARLMCGSKENLDVDAKMLSGMLASPWMVVNPEAPTPVSCGMQALMAVYQLDPNPALKRKLYAMAESHVRAAKLRGDGAYYYDGPTDVRETALGVLGDWLPVFINGRAIRALTRWSALGGQTKYLDLSGKLTQFVTAPKFWSAEAEPKAVRGADRGHFSGHHHSYTQALMGVLWDAEATQNPRLKQFVRESYEYLRNFGIARIGLFGEGCTVGDMTLLAVRLSGVGAGDYWDDADQYVRNHLAELQITDPERLRKAVERMPRGRGKNDIRDKTLVAWVYPANVTQRGGGVLTLFDQTSEAFDSIVLGERVTGRWMPGSDFFRRTASDQSAWPVETADAKTCVQIAVVYKGREITLFRDGKPYAAYQVDRPQVFDDDPMVLIGLRYLGGMGPIGHFAGAIEEARVYDVALDARTIASLRPNLASEPRPLAQWTFEDGTAADAMKTYCPGELRGGARIAGGKLWLDGKTAAMVAMLPLRPQSMFLRARRLVGQWDTWLYHHDGTHYLYLLAGPGGHWDGIGIGTSRDGCHWTELGKVLNKAEGVTWLGTGSTWKSPDFGRDKRFFLNFSEWRGPRQTIFFAESTDLVHWKRLPDQYEFRQDERWYQRNGRWDCIYTIPRKGGGLYGYWTATPKAETGGRFGFGQSLDGVRWEALPPPKVEGVGEGEVGAVEKLGERYYMMFGTGGKMVTLVADRPEGPFRAAKKNFVLLAGDTYFSRFYPTPGGMLVNHHSMAAGGVFFAPLKRAAVDPEGTLRLAWWEGNEKLKHEAIEVKQSPPRAQPASPIAMLETVFDSRNGLVLEGTVSLPASTDARPRGLYVDNGDGKGTAILVGPGGVSRIGPVSADGSGFVCKERTDREASFGASARFRLLWKGPLLEFYLNDLLMHCYGMPKEPTGRIGVMEGGSHGAIRDVKVWR